MSELQKAIEAVKLHQLPGHPIPGRIVRAYAQKFGVEPDLIMLPFINEENARPIKSLTIGEMAERQGKDGKRARRFLRNGLDSMLDYNDQVKNPYVGKNGRKRSGELMVTHVDWPNFMPRKYRYEDSLVFTFSDERGEVLVRNLSYKYE